MTERNLLKIGIVGAALSALCCFTPVLVLLFGAIGLSALTGYIDIVLLPALGIFIMIIVYSLWKQGKSG